MPKKTKSLNELVLDYLISAHIDHGEEWLKPEDIIEGLAPGHGTQINAVNLSEIPRYDEVLAALRKLKQAHLAAMLKGVNLWRANLCAQEGCEEYARVPSLTHGPRCFAHGGRFAIEPAKSIAIERAIIYLNGTLMMPETDYEIHEGRLVFAFALSPRDQIVALNLVSRTMHINTVNARVPEGVGFYPLTGLPNDRVETVKAVRSGE